MNIVCTTGFYTEHMGAGLPTYWRARDPEEIAEHYIAEIREGIAGTDGIHPGAIKAATGVEVSDAERRVLTGAAMAQRETGVAIITHTENSLHGDTQQDIFEENGADLSRVLIGHQDQIGDATALCKLAERGTYVGIDRIGFSALASDEVRADHAATLVKEGFLSQLCLSQDHVCALTGPKLPFWIPPEFRQAVAEGREQMQWDASGRPYTYIVTDFVPMLLERGVTEKDIDTIFVDNPRRLLSGDL